VARLSIQIAFTDDDEPAIDGNPCHTPLGASDSCDPFGQEEELKGIFQLAPSVSEYFVYIRSGVPFDPAPAL
jgi:hypothetical protein